MSRPPGWEHLIPQSPLSGSVNLEKSSDCSPETSPPPDREKNSALSTPEPGVLAEKRYIISGPGNLEKIMGSSPEIGGSPCQENINPQLTTLSENNNSTLSSPINKTNMVGSPETSPPPGSEIGCSQPTSPPLPGSVNSEKSMGSFPENSSPPGWENSQPQPTPSPGLVNVEKNVDGFPETVELPSQPTFQGSVNMEKCTVNSPEISLPPGWENVPTQPIDPPEPLQGSVNIEKSVGSSPDPSLPPGWENVTVQPVLPHPSILGSLNLEKNVDGSSESVEPSVQPTLPGSPNIEKSTVSSPEISLPPGWENGCSQLIPPASLPGSVNIENSLVSSPEISLPPGWENASSQPIPPLPSLPEMCQLVCGSCRQLLLYPRGTMHVQCPCCQIINFVLEEHEVGNVKCGNCFVLLMYPYGAPSVRCSACCFVTEIGPHNVRPRLSVQQGRAPLPPQNLVRVQI